MIYYIIRYYYIVPQGGGGRKFLQYLVLTLIFGRVSKSVCARASRGCFREYEMDIFARSAWRRFRWYEMDIFARSARRHFKWYEITIFSCAPRDAVLGRMSHQFSRALRDVVFDSMYGTVVFAASDRPSRSMPYCIFRGPYKKKRDGFNTFIEPGPSEHHYFFDV